MAAQSKLLQPETNAPDMAFTDITGVESSLHEFAKGKPLLLVFLQTACRSCQREMAFLSDMRKKGTEIDVLGVFVDMRKGDFNAYVKKHDLDFTFTWDGKYAMADLYGVSFTPSSFLLDKNRVIKNVYRGWSRKGKPIDKDIEALGGK
jgi:peroxiredoxin